jgi:hypothetical protein
MISRWSLLLALLLPLIVLAQLGPTITSPSTNTTVHPGESIDITFEYENLGTGNYSVDIVAINDLSNPVPIVNITTDLQVPDGNSTGWNLNFTLDYTYSGWKVPHGLLNETFWIVVVEQYSLVTAGNSPSKAVGGPALLLRNSLGVNLNPSFTFVALTIAALSMVSLLM